METIKSEKNGTPAHELALGSIAENPKEIEIEAEPIALVLEDA